MPDEQEDEQEESGPNILEQVGKAQKAVKFLSALIPLLQPILIILGIIILIIAAIILIGFVLSSVASFLGGIYGTDPIQGFANNGGGGGGSGTGALTAPANLNPQTAGDCLDKYIKDNVPSSPMIGKGETFVQSGQQYNVNPALMAAIGHHESQFNTTPADIASNPNHPLYYNYYGLSSDDPTFRLGSNGRITSCTPRPSNEGGYYVGYFVDWHESIYEHGYQMAAYLKAGDNTIEKIGKSYATDGSWANDVSTKFGSIVSKCPEFSSSLGGSGAGESVLDIARDELGTCENPMGSNHVDKPYNIDDQWCAAFATWVYRKAGYASTPKLNVTTDLYSFFKSTAGFYGFEAEDDTPQPGDLVFIARSKYVNQYGPGILGIGHVAIVETVNGNTVNTIDGNAGDCVSRNSYILQKNGGADKAVGFGRPK